MMERIRQQYGTIFGSSDGGGQAVHPFFYDDAKDSDPGRIRVELRFVEVGVRFGFAERCKYS